MYFYIFLKFCFDFLNVECKFNFPQNIVAIFVFCITFFLVSLRMIFLEFLEHDGTYDKRYSKLYQRVAIGRQ